MRGSFHARGSWPGPIVFRQGWALAEGRPWNDDLNQAALRLTRGQASFMRTAAEWLVTAGTESVVSPPMHADACSLWSQAGFEETRSLLVMERDLSLAFSEPLLAVRPGRQHELSEAVEIDSAAFAPPWRASRLGLTEALSATQRSRFLVCEVDETVVGFAIVGVTGPGAYLQRIAVHPDFQGRGCGGSLVASSLRWGRGRGANVMILNTPPENERATSLYVKNRFATLPDRLHLLEYRP